MNEVDIYRQQIESADRALNVALDGVTDENLHQRPGPHLNPAGWNYWHLLRVWDLDLNHLIRGQSRGKDAWHRGGFTERTGYEPLGNGRGGSGNGFGYTDAEVDAIQMPLADLRAYHDMLLEETRAYLDSADEAEMGREFPSPTNPSEMLTPRQRLQHHIGHVWNHVGEMRYAKGVIGITDSTYPGK